MAHPFPRTARAGWFVGVLAAIGSLNTSMAIAQPAAGAAPNLALGRPYTLTPRPNYALTTDADDDRQLTDGAYTAWDPIWLRPSTVGWQTETPVTITIDLQSVQPIAGVSFSTAAGRAGVKWPRAIYALVSDDNQHFYPVGDLAAIPAGAGAPPANDYAAYRFARSDLRTHGRYVALIVEPSGPYIFADEIEVQGGDQPSLDLPFIGDPTTDLGDYFVKARQHALIQQRLATDLAAARAALGGSSVDEGLRAALAAELNEIDAAIPLQPAVDPDEFVTILPMGDLHARILAVHGRLAAAEGRPALSLWAPNPWDFVRMLDKPPSDAARELTISAMNGETRSGAISVSNSTGEPMKLAVHVTGDPGASAGLRLAEVVWTDTRELIPVADALVPLPGEDATIDLPAGMTRQLWISFSPRQREAGAGQAFVDLTAEDGSSVRATVQLNVLAGRFPDRPTLHVGGWDYTDREAPLGVPSGALSPFIDLLRGLGVDSPWATAAVMPAASFDANGHLERLPDTSSFDRWIAQWPGATRYFVFLNAGDAIGTVRTTEGPRFAAAVGSWITFWVSHAASLGIQPPQLSLLLVDEPATVSQDERIGIWGRAIKAAQPRVAIWENPNFRDPAATPLQLLEVSDEVALERSLIDQSGAPFLDFYRRRSQAGQRLAVYGASGPARLVDPYTYYRLQPWLCAAIGASTSFFWSFSDTGEGRSWNEYAAKRTDYSPFFISTTDVTLSKHAEALREGVEDFEYLSMLRRQLDAGGDAVPEAVAATATEILRTAAADVVGAAGASDTPWMSAANRVGAERVRLRIGELLASLPEAVPDRAHLVLNGGAFVFDGAAHPATAIVTDASGVPVVGALNIEYEPGGVVPPVHAGTYRAVARFTSLDPRFLDDTATTTVMVAPATPAVTVGGHALYDGLPHGAKATAIGLGGFVVAGNATLTYSPGSNAAPIQPGAYAVVAAFVSGDPDYRDTSAIGWMTIDSPLTATLVFPPNGATSLQLPVPFHWTTVPAAERYYLYVGSTAGAKDLVNTGETAATSYRADALPRGRTLYVRLWTKVGGVWRFADSQFSIPAPTIVRVTDRSDVFDGMSHGATATATDAEGRPVPGSVMLTYAPGDAAAPVRAGTYAVTAVFTSADPRFENALGTGSVVIEPAVPRLSVAMERVVFDGDIHRASAAAEGIDGIPVAGEFTFDYSPGSAAPRDAGEYHVSATFTSSDPDYSGSTASGSVTIVPAAPVVILTAGPVVFDRGSHAAAASIVDRHGATVAGVVTLTYQPGGASPPVNSGAYAVTVLFTSTDPNYVNVAAAATLTVGPALPRIVVTERTFSYDGQPHATTATAVGLDGLPLPGTLALTYAPGGAEPPVKPGTYAVTAAFTSSDPNYVSAGGTGSLAIEAVPLTAALAYPADGATGVDLSIPLQWTAVARPDTYYLYVGSSRGAKDLVNSGETGATSYRISSLVRGETVFVRLWTKVQGVWRYSDSTFTAARLMATMTYPLPNATGVDLSRPLQWTPVDGAQAYYVWIGATPGAKDLLNSGEITATWLLASAMPPNQRLYVRLWTKAGGIWRYSDNTVEGALPGVLR